VKNLTIKNVRGNCGSAAFTNVSSAGDCFSMENVVLEDWVVEGCKTGVEIGGGVKCSNFTVKNSIFSAATGQDSISIELWGRGQTLELKRMMIDNVVFDGFSTGLKVDKDVLIENTVRVVNSDFNGAKN
jgi:hypothetical protein